MTKYSGGRAALHGFIFQQLVAELLAKLGFSDVQLEPGGPDMGVDIIAKYPTNTPTGDTAYNRYAVQVKHRPQCEALSGVAAQRRR